MAKSQHVRKVRKLRAKAGVYISAAVLATIMITAFAFIVINNLDNAKIAATGAGIYFYDAQTSNLRPEYRQLPDAENTEKVKFVLEELAVGPKAPMLTASVPVDVIKSATISGANADVTVSGKYYGLKNEEEIICRSAIVRSLADLDFIETVTINIDGSELLRPNGQPFGKMSASDIVMNPDVSPQGESLKTITLYFADLDNTGLVPETRVISAGPNEPVTKYIVLELIRGPESDRLLPTVPPETKLLEINVVDGVCSVDLSRDFIAKHTGESGSELLTIYSIVNSLCEQSDIKSVQFLIENRRQEQFKDETGFNNLYEAREMPPDTE